MQLMQLGRGRGDKHDYLGPETERNKGHDILGVVEQPGGGAETKVPAEECGMDTLMCY